MVEIFHILSFFAPVDIDEDSLNVLSKGRQVLCSHIFGEFDSMELVE